MNRTRVLTSVSLCIAVACSSAPNLPYEARGTDWVVRAERAGDAERVGRLLDRLVPAVRAELGAQAALVTVLVTREGMPDQADGRTLRNGVILLDPTATDAEALVAHEIAHTFFQVEDTWSRLPQVLEEGLANVVAGRVLPQCALGLQIRQTELLTTSGSRESGRRALRSVLGMKDYAEGAHGAFDARAIGFVLARRLGVEGVRDLCVEARRREHDAIPSDWILDACGVGADVEIGLWQRVLREADPDGWTSFSIGDGDPTPGRMHLPLDEQAASIRAASATDAATESAPPST